MKVRPEDLEDLSLGAVFLATGGGGDPYVPKLVTQRALETHGPVELIDAESLDDDATVVTIGGVGAPTASLELLPSLHDADRTLAAFEKEFGRPIDALVSFEIGGGNSLIPIMAAASRGLPVIDGDGMGRALPEAQMMTYPISGVCPTPAVAMDYRGEFRRFDMPSIFDYEAAIRDFALTNGGMVTAAEHPMTGRQLKDSVVAGTVTFSGRLGRLLREQRGNARAIEPALKALFEDSIYGELRHIYTGKVVDSERSIEGGFDVGSVSLETFESDGTTPLVLTIKNEFLVARQDGRVLASVPDLITVVDYETSAPINAERLRYGQRVCVYAIGCPAYYRTEAALKVVSPRAFGFDFDYVPLEELSGP